MDFVVWSKIIDWLIDNAYVFERLLKVKYFKDCKWCAKDTQLQYKSYNHRRLIFSDSDERNERVSAILSSSTNATTYFIYLFTQLF